MLFPDPELEPLIHDCQQVLAEAHSWWKDLSDHPLTNAEVTWYTDGSSFLENGQRRAGAAVVDGQRTTWAQSLPERTSVQKAELIALTKALELAEGGKGLTSTQTAGLPLPLPMYMGRSTSREASSCLEEK